MRWLLTCQAIGEDYVWEMQHMVESFQNFHPAIPVVTCSVMDRGCSWQAASNRKIGWLRGVYNMFPDFDILWVDADARFRRAIELPPVSEFDVGAQNYQAWGWRIATGTIWLHRTAATAELLNEWLLRSAGRKRQDSYTNERLLARILVKMTQVRFLDLPRTMSSVCDTKGRWDGTLMHDSAIVHWNRGRRYLDKQRRWPPSEKDRAAATVRKAP